MGTMFGGMLSIRVRGGLASALEVLRLVRLWAPATSFGGVESLVEHRATVEGPTSGIPADLLRLSVGLEDLEDLYQDLSRALDGKKPTAGFRRLMYLFTLCFLSNVRVLALEYGGRDNNINNNSNQQKGKTNMKKTCRTCEKTGEQVIR